MIREPNSITHFPVGREAGQNPYIGLTDFQHFRHGKLYSDIVVRPEANMTETERVECYPVSADAEECTRDTGWYPDATVVYIRVLWKEFEPALGEYNYAFIEDILRNAKAGGQTLIFRLMAHSTRWQDDVPEWLKSIVDCPARPDGKRIKDSPTDPQFITLFLAAVRAFGERFDSDPTLCGVDISLPGAWGEGHRLEDYPDGTFEQIVDTYLDVFRNTQLYTQAARPNLIHYAAERGVKVGWRGDGIGHPKITFENYPKTVEAVSDNWRIAPVSFESYWWLGEWLRHEWDVQRIMEQTLAWHLSTFNAKSIDIPICLKPQVEDWIARMGYHFAPRTFACPKEAATGDTVKTVLTIENTGVAPIYHRHTLSLRLRRGDIVHVLPTDTDITTWLPGIHTVETVFVLPPLPAGEYAVEIGLDGPTDTGIYLSTAAETNGHFYRAASLTVLQ